MELNAGRPSQASTAVASQTFKRRLYPNRTIRLIAARSRPGGGTDLPQPASSLLALSELLGPTGKWSTNRPWAPAATSAPRPPRALRLNGLHPAARCAGRLRFNRFSFMLPVNYDSVTDLAPGVIALAAIRTSSRCRVYVAADFRSASFID